MKIAVQKSITSAQSCKADFSETLITPDILLFPDLSASGMEAPSHASMQELQRLPTSAIQRPPKRSAIPNRLESSTLNLDPYEVAACG